MKMCAQCYWFPVCDAKVNLGREYYCQTKFKIVLGSVEK